MKSIIHVNTVYLPSGGARYERPESKVSIVSVWNRCRDKKIVRFTLLNCSDQLQVEIADADSNVLDGKFMEEEDP
jgi:hypothetical protein